ncbi:MAG: M23 family metallopeptidase [Chitinophagales bacterium]|jgi:murein DD-endopeptidase MepM/ murein hydrolase activator NlpD|nr:M23 family metallopeptidase [Chitinophagales bacterium]
MNNFWNFKKELKIILLAFLVVLSLPLIAIIILTQTGINLVSDKLVDQTGIENRVEILDPITGEVTYTINQAMYWPTTGVVTLEFGVPHLPYQILHTGIDIANNKGTNITPFMGGTVTYAAETKIGYGKHIIIDHGNNVTSLYGHLDKILVYKGQVVTTDQVIGLMGTTGWSTGNHLHFQINVYGIPVNPRVFLVDNDE